AAATILNPIADSGNASIENSSARAKLLAQDIRQSRSKRAADPPDMESHVIGTLYFQQAGIIAGVVCSLIVAGFLKGIIGVGMPVVALPLLSLFIDIKSAAMLLSMPLIFSNLPQALEGGKTGRCLMQVAEDQGHA